MTPSEMVDMVRSHLDTSRNFLPGDIAMQHLHAAQQEIVRQIIAENPTFYIASTTLDLVSGTALYDLPQNARLGARILFAENTQDDVGVRVPPARFREHFFIEEPGLLSLVHGYSFTLQGAQVRVTPEPVASVTSAIRIWYGPEHGNMVQGVPTAATDTTVTLFETPNYTNNFGVIDLRDDYYNGMELRVISGTGAGQSFSVSDYVGSTRTLTIDGTFTTALATSGEDASVVALMCPVPEGFHALLPLRAALLASPRHRTRQKELEREYYGAMGARPGLLYNLLSWVSRRSDDATQRVEPVDYGDV